MTKAFWALLPFAALSALSLHAGNITFSDGTFNPPDWTSTTVASTGTASVAVATQSSGGDPGAYRGIALTVGLTSSITDVELWSLAVYNPSTQGSVLSAAMSYNATRISSTNVAATQVVEGFAVEQGVNIYTYFLGVTTNGSPTWDTASIANVVALFPSVNWINGGPITFGLYDAVGSSSTAFTITGGYDNFLVQVTNGSGVVPEPSGATLSACGLLAVALLFRVRRRRSTQGN